MHSLYSVFRRIQVRVGAVLARVGIWEESRWRRPGSRRGGGGVGRGGDACIALGGSTLPQPGRCKHPHPAPHRPRPYAAVIITHIFWSISVYRGDKASERTESSTSYPPGR